MLKTCWEWVTQHHDGYLLQLPVSLTIKCSRFSSNKQICLTFDLNYFPCNSEQLLTKYFLIRSNWEANFSSCLWLWLIWRPDFLSAHDHGPNTNTRENFWSVQQSKDKLSFYHLIFRLYATKTKPNSIKILWFCNWIIFLIMKT